MAFALPIGLSLSQLTSFLTFTLLSLSPTPTRGKWAGGCMVLGYQLDLNHYNPIARNWVSRGAALRWMGAAHVKKWLTKKLGRKKHVKGL